MEGKYLVYENDLKFKNSLEFNLNVDKINNDENNVKSLLNTNLETLDYRINECIKHKYDYLDLSYLNLDKLPILDIKLVEQIKHLFINNNKLNGEINLTMFKLITTLDIANNNITKIILPNSLEELKCSDNNLTELIGAPNLQRLNCVNNKLITLDKYIKLTILESSYNKLSNINKLINLQKLIINDNPLNYLCLSNNLIYLDMSNTLITDTIVLNNMTNLKYLIANNTKIKNIPILNNLIHLEIINTPIEKLYFYKNIDIILFSANLTKCVSNKYKSHNYIIKLRNNSIICISKNEIQIMN